MRLGLRACWFRSSRRILNFFFHRTAIGIRCVDGVVLGLENPVLSKMLLPGGNRRVFTVDEHVGVAMAGFAPDARKVVEIARKLSSDYRGTYGGPIPGRILNQNLAYVPRIDIKCFSLFFEVPISIITRNSPISGRSGHQC